jgi:ABC-type lipoprotein export system ATPase subunit
MADIKNIASRGSWWGRWDLHIHTNASDGSGTCEEILKEAKKKKIRCIAVTDHHTFANIDEMKRLASNYGVSIISGVEIRTEYGDSSVHMIGLFPDEYNGTKLTTQFLHDNVLSPLGLSRTAIIEKGRKLKQQENEDACFKDGMFQVQTKFKTAADLIHKYGGLVTVHAGGKVNSIETMKHDGSGSRNTTIEHTLGPVKEELFQEGYIDICDITHQKDATFYMKKFGKPSITTSDAHKVEEVGTNPCWIKAETTFEGLRQVLIENSRISYDEPEVLQRLRRNPDKFIINLLIKRTTNATMPEVWFDNINIPLNPGMVAIIGNKGSGKSAIADILALCADASTNGYLSFLTATKFRMNKPYNRSHQIEANIQWVDKSYSPTKTLDIDVDRTQPERVKYIPQNFLETICTTEEDEKFESELKKIIFQYLQPEDRYGQDSLDEIIEYLTDENSKSCALIKEVITGLNERIIVLEQMLDPNYKTMLQNQLKYKQDQLSNAQSAKPKEVTKPNMAGDAEALQVKNVIDSLIFDINNLKTEIQRKKEALIQKKKELQDLIAVKENLNRLDRQIEDVLSQIKETLDKCNIDIKTIFNVQYKPEILDGLIIAVSSEVSELNKELNDEAQGLAVKLSLRIAELSEAQKKLSEPELKYQEYLRQKHTWEKQIEEITGTAEKEGSIKYFQAKIEYVEHCLQQDLISLRAERRSSVIQLMNKKAEVLATYNTLFAPVVDFIKKYSSELNDYPIEFDAAFSIRKFSDRFFDYVGQQVSGSFYGKEAGMTRLNESIESIDLSDIDSMVAFPENINEDLLFDRRDPSRPLAKNVADQLRKGHTQQELYSYMYGMDYVVPFFQLKMNGKPLASLSPGERGALLLLLYLFIDMDDKPLIIDQPEENLDNESVYKYLVGFIRQAKKKRQIIIVTHNPNLAVVCDADQVIRMNIDKQNKNTVTFLSGAIENPIMNKQIVDVLEGTYPAFHNRDCKYIEKS